MEDSRFLQCLAADYGDLRDAASAAEPQAAPRTRMEKDLLGEKAVPADAYYGVQTARAL